jgi:hypothetical protein
MSYLAATWDLYRSALSATIRSFRLGWIVALALVLFLGIMMIATTIAAPLGIAGGFILGAVNALVIGATLFLFELAVKASRPVSLRDIQESFGKYFWDVIGVGFVLWIPLMLLDQGMAANPQGAFIAAAVFFLLFILLNPAPEVIYQLRHDSPLEVMKTSYEFVLENWIEWFLPLVIVIGPLGLTFFFTLSARLGRGAGLDFMQLLVLPFTALTAWLAQLGMSEEVSALLVLICTPPLTVLMFLFRGHLFQALQGSSRRQRLYKTRHKQ